jgi:uncharacterized membrane protein
MSDQHRPPGDLQIADPDAPPKAPAMPKAAAFGTPATPPFKESAALPLVAEAPPTEAADQLEPQTKPKRRRSPKPTATPREELSLEERLQRRVPVAAPAMSERARFLLATLCGLILALGVHLVMVLAMPRVATQDAFSRLRGTMEAETAVLVAGTGRAETWIPLHDPAAAVAACAYDLTEGPVRISARTGPLVQSISFHNRGGGVFYAVTDRAAVRGQLDLVVMTRRQYDEALAAEEQEAPSRDVRVIAPRREGFMIVRAVAPSASLRPQAEEVVRAVGCVAEGEGGMAEPPAPAAPPAPAPAAPAQQPAPAPAAPPAARPGPAQAPTRPAPGQHGAR